LLTRLHAINNRLIGNRFGLLGMQLIFDHCTFLYDLASFTGQLPEQLISRIRTLPGIQLALKTELCNGISTALIVHRLDG
jgi:hypothetical protein